MVDDIDRIYRFIEDCPRDQLASREEKLFAVCYAFVRLGEAVSHVPPAVQESHPEVEWGDIKHFRNFMVHVYPAVDPVRLYDTAKDNLPPLRAKLVAILRG